MRILVREDRRVPALTGNPGGMTTTIRLLLMLASISAACSAAGGGGGDDQSSAGAGGNGTDNLGGGAGENVGAGGDGGGDVGGGAQGGAAAAPANGGIGGGAAGDSAGGSPGTGGAPTTGGSGGASTVPHGELYIPPSMTGKFDLSDKKWTFQPEALSMAGVPAGKVSNDLFTSTSAWPGRAYKVIIYVPSQYDVTKPAALMVWQDGTRMLGNLRTVTVTNNLIHLGLAPVTINIFVDPSSEANRSEEYDSVTDRYARLLIDELLPAIISKNKFNITPDPEGHAIGGHSSGGAAAFTVAWQRPDYFRRVATGNGSFVGLRGADQYPNLIRTTPVKPLRVTLLSGDGDLTGFGGWLAANNKMSDALLAAKYHYRYIYARLVTHEERYFAMTVVYDLMFLWDGYRL